MRSRARSIGKLGALALTAALAAGVAASPAGAYTTAAGFTASTYASGLPDSAVSDWGPIGIAFDQSDNLYVADRADGNLYRFQPGGGVASGATRLTSSPIPGEITGLAVSSTGRIYLARYQAGDVVEVDPATGAILRTVANVPCATGLALDPVSGDLFVSQNQCGATIYRISGYQSGPGAVSAYATAPGVDGLAFDSSGNLYAESNGEILQIDGTASETPGLATSLANVPHADGLAFGAHVGGLPPFLVTNGNDGKVTRVDFGTSPPSESELFSGGSRGDFEAVDSRGCLYITQSDSIVRISAINETCSLEPTTSGPAPGPGLTVSDLSGAGGSAHPGTRPRGSRHACLARRSLRLRITQRGRVRLSSAVIYLNGHRVRSLRGPAVTAPFTLRHLPARPFVIKIVALTTRRRRLVEIKRYSNCAPRHRAARRHGKPKPRRKPTHRRKPRPSRG